MEAIINIDQICEISTHPKRRNRNYRYRPQGKNWWGKVLMERLEDTFYGGESYEIDEFLKKNKNFIFEDNVVYYKPHIKMYLTNRNIETKYFETVDEMDEFLNAELKEKLNLINIE